MKRLSIALIVIALLSSAILRAEGDTNTATNSDEIQALSPEAQRQKALDSLDSIKSSLKEKRTEQATLQRAIRNANELKKAELTAELEQLSADIKRLEQSFEQVAIGGINLESLTEEEKPFDWKEELVLVTQPLLESLNGLTEKPRKIDKLRTLIDTRREKSEDIAKAIDSLEGLISKTNNVKTTVSKELQTALDTWQDRQKENQQQIELAEFQLATLLGDNTPLYISVWNGLRDFFQGRGLTLLYAAIASAGVWLFMRALLWIVQLRKRRIRANDPNRVTGYRAASYLYKLLTTFLIIIAVMLVLYTRGDLLLLALVIIVFTGIAFTLRQLLPKYIAEARLLFNIGSVREKERVIYNGIPWSVETINVYSVFRNPLLNGIARLPLSELVQLNSRPVIREENWFPTSRGDLLLMPNGSMAEVLRQTPDFVELESKAGMRSSHPTPAFIGMDFYNLSRGQSYGVASTFGIDYRHIDIALTEVARVFREAIEQGLRSAGLGEHVMDILVDFSRANDSSLDYLIYVTMNSRAASSYFKVQRLIQQRCVAACNQNSWGIPFPQRVIHSDRG